MARRLLGTVVSFDTARDFGLIKPDGWIKRILVRKSVLDEAGYAALCEGDRVEFVVTHDDRYIPVAADLRRLAGRAAG